MQTADHRRQRSRGELPRAEEGDGLRAHRAQAVPARGDGLAPVRALVGERRELRRRTRSTASRASSRRSRSSKLLTRAADGRDAREVHAGARSTRARGSARSRSPSPSRSGTTCSRTRTTSEARTRWRRWCRPSAWRSTSARSTSASPTSSARTWGRRSAASSPATQGLKTDVEHAARRARHHRHGDRPRARGPQAGRRDPVLRLRLQHHRPAQDRRQHLLVERRRLERADGDDDARRRRHPRQHLPLALVRRAGDAHPRLEDRDAVEPARRVRAPASARSRIRTR